MSFLHIFSIIFYLSYLQQAYSGPGLAFIVFAEAVKNLPIPTIWGIAFFAMLINLGIGSMLGTMEGIITPLTNLFPRFNVLLVTCKYLSG